MYAHNTWWVAELFSGSIISQQLVVIPSLFFQHFAFLLIPPGCSSLQSGLWIFDGLVSVCRHDFRAVEMSLRVFSVIGLVADILMAPFRLTFVQKRWKLVCKMLLLVRTQSVPLLDRRMRTTPEYKRGQGRLGIKAHWNRSNIHSNSH